MSAEVLGPPSLFGSSLKMELRRNRGLVLAISVFVIVFAGLNLALTNPFGYFDVASTLNNTGTLAIAAMGQSLVVIAGGLDLSAGAVISLSNCIFVNGVGDSSNMGTGLLWATIAVSSGALAGALNGFFIAYLRLQPIVVTLATMFIIQGITLLVRHEPGGAVSVAYTSLFTDDVIPGVIPASLLVIIAFLLLWGLLKRTRLGVNIYAIGSDENAARANGVPTKTTKFAAYTLSGACYGFAGLLLAAQTGSADPLVGSSMLLPIFVAVLLGGNPLGGGRGGCVGAVFGSLTLMLIVNLLLVMRVSTSFGTAVEGLLMILAVLGNSFAKGSPLWQRWRTLISRWQKFRDGSQARLRKVNQPLNMAIQRDGDRIDDELPPTLWKAWIARNRSLLRYILPVYVSFVVILLVTALVLGHRVTVAGYFGSLLMLASLSAVIVLGQGIVILSGGLDLSMPWMVTLGGVLLTGMSAGSDYALIWTVPVVLMVATLIGIVNGLGVVVLGLSPIVMTLAMSGILQTAALVYSDGAPIAVVPNALHWLMRGKVWSFSPIVWLMIPLVIGATLLLTRTSFGRRLNAVGNSPRVAELSGVPVVSVIVTCYAISAFAAACVGLMLSGMEFQATLDMGEPFLMPSIAAAVMGGTLITGGRGHYIGMFGGALLLTALSTLLTGILLPAAVRSIIFGGVVLVAVLALRDRGSD